MTREMQAAVEWVRHLYEQTGITCKAFAEYLRLLHAVGLRACSAPQQNLSARLERHMGFSLHPTSFWARKNTTPRH